MIDNEVVVYGEVLPEALEQAKNSLEDNNIVRLMADHHIGYGVPIGGVVASKNKISLHGVGYDIGCGNCAYVLDLKYSDIKDNLVEIGREISKIISFGIGKNSSLEETQYSELLNDERFDDPRVKDLKQIAINQFGTVGSGNHYVDILYSQKDDLVYIANHFGSRGFGHKLATKYYSLFESKDDMMSKPVYADLDTELGQDYLFCMTLAGEYANSARNHVIESIRKLVFNNVQIVDHIENHHNFSWKETHFGEDYYVTRKGATPLYLNKLSFIGGSMTTNSYIVKGKESEQYYNSLRSTVHGAGRLVSRSKAKGNRKGTKQGLFSHINMRQFAKDSGIVLFGGGQDELPMCYKNIDEVINYHSDSLEIVDVLTPVIVLMAGENEHDPYKD